MEVVKKQHIEEAYVWTENGSIPGECTGVFTEGTFVGLPFEGSIVRYFRHPGISGTDLCPECGLIYNDHGWLDHGEDGTKVCPGSVVVRIRSDWTVMSKEKFDRMYSVVKNDNPITHHTFQERLYQWFLHTFSEQFPQLIDNKREKSHRFIEEAIELVQACNLTKQELIEIVNVVYDKPSGDIFKEAGGVATTLSLLCQNHGFQLNAAAEAEYERNFTIIDKLREKQPFRTSMVTES